MQFKIKTSSEGEFEDILQKVIEENNIQPPSQKSIDRDSSNLMSIYTLQDQFINRLAKANPKAIDELQAVR